MPHHIHFGTIFFLKVTSFLCVCERIKCVYKYVDVEIVSLYINIGGRFSCNYFLLKITDKDLVFSFFLSSFNYTRMLWAILNRSWRQHPIKHQLYGHLPPITKTIQVRWTRHAGYCCRSRVELISDVLLWTPSCGQTKAGRPARTYIQQLCEDTGCSPEDLPEAMNVRGRVVREDQGYPCWWHDKMMRWWWSFLENKMLQPCLNAGIYIYFLYDCVLLMKLWVQDFKSPQFEYFRFYPFSAITVSSDLFMLKLSLFEFLIYMHAYIWI